ncbi:hypothetical protein SAMN04488128_104132 [Chitinophaga eiseniae]|uniref:Uncharacterized protein n=1 Tax=Chitinophaga eiseniae TaxID=634771 RepID=A0A1T4T7R7_9BACT|nr:hypothetical protein [Chitinophaga eiseniae]SKA36542.1 hypothetical protein SAMN04488128_104132 [Chitinophaga eiseniae]
MEKQRVILRNSKLKPPEDFNFLRQQGMQYIQQLGSRFWTDYNLHDPGITTLELLCFAITDLAYRTGFPTADLFAAYMDKSQLHKQAFFPAHEILTMNPLTINDYRKLMIDQEGIHNAWLAPRHCSCDDTTATGTIDECADDCNCETEIYADEKNGQLTYKSHTPDGKQAFEKVNIKGLYDVQIALDDDPVFGDINDGRVYQTLTYGSSRATIELRLPAYEDILKKWNDWKDLIDNTITVTTVALNKMVDNNGTPVTDSNLSKTMQRAIFIDLQLTLSNAVVITFNNAVLNIYLSFSDAGALAVADITSALQQVPGIISTYKNGLEKTHALINATRANLNAHRNLDEAFCHISLVPMEDVSICMDAELTPDADIEKVQAEIMVRIEQYLNPNIPIYSLAQLLKEDTDITEIFNGPRLHNGFIKNEDLDKTDIKQEIHASDMINLIMDIPEVVSITNFLMTSYDDRGEVIYHSQPWILPITPDHQPRLYVQRSKFLFYKNGLPFLAASEAELNSILQELRSSNEYLKATGISNELEIPAATIRNMEDYYPVQYSYPLTYGIGEFGLSDTEPALRKAQARQLKTYLLFFEQLLVNYLAQLQHAGDLFLVDSSQLQSYFTHWLSDSDIKGVTALYNGLTPPSLQALTEPPNGGLTRRNRFLDHLLARFAESFSEYALARYSSIPAEQTAMQTALLQLKTDFLSNYPEASYNRARAIDYSIIAPCTPGNIAGLQRRLNSLLNIDAATSFVIIEHLLLRPRIPGQALLPICLDGSCHTCYDNDPYSFRLTFVMPGWLEQNMKIDYRRYAEKTIRQETPAHLLPKICWVDNKACDNTLLCDLTDLLWGLQVPLPPTRDEETLRQLCLVAQAAIAAMNNAYRQALATGNNVFPVKAEVEQFFEDKVKDGIVNGVTGITPAGVATVKIWIVDYWLAHTDCFIFTRLELAWCAWLTANAKLTAKDNYLENILTDALLKANPGKQQQDICPCVHSLMEQYGETIRLWVVSQLAGGLQKAAFDTMINAVAPVCNGIVTTPVNTVFTTFYDTDKIQLLQTHATLIQVMSALKSIYPPATLHDCEDGNDVNPVRLGATAIG